MQIPFTAEQFLRVFKQYNETIWPFQIMLYFFALLAVFFSFIKGKHSRKNYFHDSFAYVDMDGRRLPYTLFFQHQQSCLYFRWCIYFARNSFFLFFISSKKTHISRCLLLLAMPMVINSF